LFLFSALISIGSRTLSWHLKVNAIVLDVNDLIDSHLQSNWRRYQSQYECMNPNPGGTASLSLRSREYGSYKRKRADRWLHWVPLNRPDLLTVSRAAYNGSRCDNYSYLYQTYDKLLNNICFFWVCPESYRLFQALSSIATTPRYLGSP
jgi:hypothetical protein